MLCAMLLFSAPNVALAYPFGGQTKIALPCFFSGSILALIGPPNPGIYLWTPITRTYSNGPPAPGKWLLGLTSIPYICVILPIGPVVIPGVAIEMMGSSGAPAPAYVPPPFVGSGGTSGGGGTSGQF